MFSALRQEVPAGHYISGKWVPYYKTLKNNKEMGLEKGIPDLLIMPEVNGKKYLVFIEMKRAKGKVSKEQKKWIDTINRVDGGVMAMVCYNSGEVIDYLEALYKI